MSLMLNPLHPSTFTLAQLPALLLLREYGTVPGARAQ